MDSKSRYLTSLGEATITSLLLLAIILVVYIIPWPVASSTETELTDLGAVESHIKWFHQNVSEKKLNKALKHAPVVVEVAHKYDVDPILIAVQIDVESSWNSKANGAIGEEGLMQVHGIARMGFDMSTPKGQIEAGVNHLVMWNEKCRGVLEWTLCGYHSGHCRSSKCRGKKRAKLWRKARVRLNLPTLTSPFDVSKQVNGRIM